MRRLIDHPALLAPPLPHLQHNAAHQHLALCRLLARLALRSLHQELVLYPKPGLVSRVDNGSHADMTAETFLRSLFALRHYFFQIATAGLEGAPFHTLQRLAIRAEERMLRATGGVNTHRGAIFALGMLCAAMACCRGRRLPLQPATVRATLLIQWGDALARHSAAISGGSHSHGQRVAARHAVGGAREEAALGFPSVFEVALPQLQATLAQGRDAYHARIDTLFALMAQLSDTNVYHRGGAEGAALVRERSAAFLAAGGTARPGWQEDAVDCHRLFVARRLSPGGAADLLAAACLVHQASLLEADAR
ncbi:2-(5'-triphosphoribosyl)-3'-dephospho CoA synthase [Herbaspirillum rubrisubalbicans]|uniref:Probable 2-(5''-triphosphoribosyl)-3'-dephosphocoenzyme-A synthase n=1 Tax=Herbaspirillum rubrisubalbicans TaxID=80842 RepID=A0ABX9BZJ6_9BURK|nr:triphosphoribosyl-dephospho-CoA synthase MdcB [Herbaspirillum rubrisubalbicans]RAM63440.1 2-(5'-triphosphoribosyl)-3'-dephospho CoA synthase [Herbaspirillum rubrisubalbicans]RAN48330.1 2-(5'-triphosphoribosyl)-3'-dephospho CoA synthase [Herbaspirillum rubrisubalbicans]